MSKSTWRDHCRPIIAQVILETGKGDMKKLRKALRETYPYGQREMWPYKVWCSEIRKQLRLDVKEVEMPLFKAEGEALDE